MGRLLGLHEISVIGATIELSTSGTTARVKILANADTAGPARYLVICDQDVYLRMGDSTVTAATTDFLLKADASMIITVEEAAHSYIAALQVTDAGTVKITRLDDKSP